MPTQKSNTHPTHIKMRLKAQRDLLGNITHCLITPLSAIQAGLGYLATSSNELDEERDFVCMLRDASHELRHYINQWLSVLANTQGPLALQVVQFSPQKIVDSLKTLLAPCVQKKGLTLSVQGVDTLPAQLKGDSNRFFSILLALLDNAIQFTSKGSVTCTVTHRVLQTNRIELTCQIKDTGIGIPKDEQAYIFEPFYCVVPTYKRADVGFGLGLTQAKQYATQLGGCITVESEPDCGSTFTCILPFESVRLPCT